MCLTILTPEFSVSNVLSFKMFLLELFVGKVYLDFQIIFKKLQITYNLKDNKNKLFLRFLLPL